MKERELLPAEERSFKVSVRDDGKLVLTAILYRAEGGWRMGVPMLFSEFSQTVTTMDEMVDFVGRMEVDGLDD